MAPADTAACAAGEVGHDADHRVLVDENCTVQVIGASGTVLAELALRPTGREAIRRILPTSSMLFVLRANPGRLEVYRLPALQPVTLVAIPSLRAPQDVAIRVGTDDSFVGYVLDNPHPYAYHDSDLPPPRPEVLRFALRPHDSDERRVLLATMQPSLKASAASGWGALERLELLPNEVRVQVREDRRRYAEFFTDDGVWLERLSLADDGVVTNPR